MRYDIDTNSIDIRSQSLCLVSDCWLSELLSLTLCSPLSTSGPAAKKTTCSLLWHLQEFKPCKPSLCVGTFSPAPPHKYHHKNTKPICLACSFKPLSALPGSLQKASAHEGQTFASPVGAHGVIGLSVPEKRVRQIMRGYCEQLCAMKFNNLDESLWRAPTIKVFPIIEINHKNNHLTIKFVVKNSPRPR